MSQVEVDPCTVVVQVLDPATSSSEDEVIGATAFTSGASTWLSSASTSDMVSVDALPSACRMPVVEVELPGVMVSTFDPRAVISEVTCPCAPSPSPTVRMTAAIPMRMPNTVSAERRRWLRTPLTPVRNVSIQLTGCSPRTAHRSQ